MVRLSLWRDRCFEDGERAARLVMWEMVAVLAWWRRQRGWFRQSEEAEVGDEGVEGLLTRFCGLNHNSFANCQWEIDGG